MNKILVISAMLIYSTSLMANPSPKAKQKDIVCKLGLNEEAEFVSMARSTEAANPRRLKSDGGPPKSPPAEFEKQNSALTFGPGAARDLLRLKSNKSNIRIAVLAQLSSLGIAIEVWQDPVIATSSFVHKSGVALQEYSRFMVNYIRVTAMDLPLGREATLQMSPEDTFSIVCMIADLEDQDKQE